MTQAQQIRHAFAWELGARVASAAFHWTSREYDEWRRLEFDRKWALDEIAGGELTPTQVAYLYGTLAILWR